MESKIFLNGGEWNPTSFFFYQCRVGMVLNTFTVEGCMQDVAVYSLVNVAMSVDDD